MERTLNLSLENNPPRLPDPVGQELGPRGSGQSCPHSFAGCTLHSHTPAGECPHRSQTRIACHGLYRLGGGWPCPHGPAGGSLQWPYAHSSPPPGVHTRQQPCQLRQPWVAPGCSVLYNLGGGAKPPVPCWSRCVPAGGCWSHTWGSLQSEEVPTAAASPLKLL